jgi:sulfur carrier protein ThiS
MKEAVPLDPVAEILKAFRSYRVVAISEGDHNNEQGHAFRLGLIRDPRFAAAVNDIVVESGNALYQDTMDRFVNGEQVPYEELRKTWQNTTQPHAIWDVPIYEELYRAVREVNASLPKERRLRVLLGDPPVDWDQVRSVEDLAKQLDRRDALVAGLIEREVLARGRRALVIYGARHLLRHERVFLPPQGMTPDDASSPAEGPSIVACLEQSGTQVFSIWTDTFASLKSIQSSIAQWQPPKLAIVANTVLGVAPHASCVAAPWYSRLRDGTVADVHEDTARSPLMQDQFDAVLYLGDVITYSKPAAILSEDAQYQEMRRGRMKLFDELIEWSNPGRMKLFDELIDRSKPGSARSQGGLEA